MTHHLTEAEKDYRYQKSYPVRAGFLPRNRASVMPFLQKLKLKADAATDLPQSTAVQEFVEVIEAHPILRLYVNRMIEEVPHEHRTVENEADLMRQLDIVTRTAPQWNADINDQHFFPMSTLFTYMMMTTSGEAIFRDPTFNDALRPILREWCRYLDSEESTWVINRDDGWLSPSAFEQLKLDQFVIPNGLAPHGGFTSYNAFFHREIKADARILHGADDPRAIVAPNDGTVYHTVSGAHLRSDFWLKAQPYSLADMLNGQWLELFEGGHVFQSFLSGKDYHRWHAPVSGKVIAAQVIDGLMFSNLESEGNDIKGVGSQGYYTAVNTRGLLAIKADDPGLGVVVVVPVGITEVSSIRHTVAKGDHVDKGQEIGHFSYGGSSLAVVFQAGAVDRFTAGPKDPIQCKQIIAMA